MKIFLLLKSLRFTRRKEDLLTNNYKKQNVEILTTTQQALVQEQLANNFHVRNKDPLYDIRLIDKNFFLMLLRS